MAKWINRDKKLQQKKVNKEYNKPFKNNSKSSKISYKDEIKFKYS